MSVFGYVALALLVAYWVWMLTKKAPTVSYVIPGIVTLVLGGVALSSYFSSPAPATVLGGKRSRYY
jgi:hypothetical protein